MTGCSYSNGDTDYYLLYRPDIEWLRSNDAILNEKLVGRISERGRKAVVSRLTNTWGRGS